MLVPGAKLEKRKKLLERVEKIRGANLSCINEFKSADTKQFLRGIIKKVKWLDKAGFNAVKLPVQWTRFASNYPECEIDERFLGVLDVVINEIRKRKMLVVLDNHSAKFNRDDPAVSRETIAVMWEKVALRYKEIPDDDLWYTIVTKYVGNFYKDIEQEINECTLSSKASILGAASQGKIGQPSLHYKKNDEIVEKVLIGEQNDSIQKVKENPSKWIKYITEEYNKVFEQALPVIRNISPNRPLILADLNVISSSFAPIKFPPEDDNLIAGTMFYYPKLFTHQGIIASSIKKNSGNCKWSYRTKWFGSETEKRMVAMSIKHLSANKERYGRPNLVFEYGCSFYANPYDRANYLNYVREVFEQNKQGRMYWDPFTDNGFVTNKKVYLWDPGALQAIIPDSPVLPAEPLFSLRMFLACLITWNRQINKGLRR